MEAYWIWWLAAVVLVIAEMNSGTFYLIAVAFGLATAGLAAYLGIAWIGQAVIAALLCTVSVGWIYFWRRRQPQLHGQGNLVYDIGQEVHVTQWLDERHARVNYRGADWDAELADKISTDMGRQVWRIKLISGSRLIIE